MIAFRNTDWRKPFLWETSEQPFGRYNKQGDGPAQYFADTSDGAWAEFIRHAEITDPDELHDVRRALWSVEIPDVTLPASDLPFATATGGLNSYPACQEYAKTLRDIGRTRIHERSAALLPGGARGQRVNTGLRNGPPREGTIVVIFEYLPNITGWCVTVGTPPPGILVVTRPL